MSTNWPYTMSNPLFAASRHHPDLVLSIPKHMFGWLSYLMVRYQLKG